MNSLQTIKKGAIINFNNNKNAFTFRYEHFGGRFKPWKVCIDDKKIRELPKFASEHSMHWPPTKVCVWV
jgi:hypothetical protein